MSPCTSPGHVPMLAHLLYTPAQATLGSQLHGPACCVIQHWASHRGRVAILIVVMLVAMSMSCLAASQATRCGTNAATAVCCGR